MSPDQIKQLRTDLGLTARQLGERLSIDQKTVLEWESGQRFPTKRHVQAMLRLRDKQQPPPMVPSTVAPTSASNPMHTLAEPAFWTLVRKLALYPKLREQVTKIAATYADDSPSD